MSGDVEVATINTYEPPKALATSPMDYSKFQQRFKSFLVKDWTKMPLELSPIACAMKGWTLLSGESIRCDFCNRTINIVLPKKNYELYKSHTKVLEDKLMSEHRIGCVWKCELNFPDYFITMEFEEEGKLEEKLLCNSRDISQHLDAFNYVQTFLKVECLTENRADLQAYAEAGDVDVIPLTVAAHGWKVRSLMQNRLLHCEICCRKVPLWNKAHNVLDLRKHFAWCPWIYAHSSSTTPVVNRIYTFISQQLRIKRKRKSKDYETSSQRKEELKEIVKYMRRSLT
ncbi:zinc finger C3HC-type protein 1-like [Watersipora subatra]|uniref:zinc finger C3HC-type protein 1-like n=1 Tax=Watersipora subatra TaxID=2589382 RepID=UPI00355BD80E